MVDKEHMNKIFPDHTDKSVWYSTGAAVKAEIAEYERQMQILKKSQGDANNATAEDQILLSATQHVRRQVKGKSESIHELIARTGISPGQIRTWSRHEIAKFCAAAEERAKDEFRPSGHSAILSDSIEDRPQINSRFVMVP